MTAPQWPGIGNLPIGDQLQGAGAMLGNERKCTRAEAKWMIESVILAWLHKPRMNCDVTVEQDDNGYSIRVDLPKPLSDDAVQIIGGRS